MAEMSRYELMKVAHGYRITRGYWANYSLEDQLDWLISPESKYINTGEEELVDG